MVCLWCGGGGLSASNVVGQQVIFETGRTPVVTQFTTTVNANNFVLVERTIWHSKHPFLYPILLRNVYLCCHPQYYCCITFCFTKLQGRKRVVITVCAYVNHESKKEKFVLTCYYPLNSHSYKVGLDAQGALKCHGNVEIKAHLWNDVHWLIYSSRSMDHYNCSFLFLFLFFLLLSL